MCKTPIVVRPTLKVDAKLREYVGELKSPLFYIATVAEVAVKFLVDSLYKEGREGSRTLLVRAHGNSPWRHAEAMVYHQDHLPFRYK